MAIHGCNAFFSFFKSCLFHFLSESFFKLFIPKGCTCILVQIFIFELLLPAKKRMSFVLKMHVHVHSIMHMVCSNGSALQCIFISLVDIFFGHTTTV